MSRDLSEGIRHELNESQLPTGRSHRFSNRFTNLFSRQEISDMTDSEALISKRNQETESTTNKEHQRMRKHLYRQAQEGISYYPDLLGALLVAKNPTDPYHWDTVEEILPATTDMDRELRQTEPKRWRWGGPFHFAIIVLAGSLSWSTLSTFPWVLFYSSSGYFFFVIIILVATGVAIPLMQLQHLLGQLYQGAPVKVFSVLHLRTRGVGIAASFMSLFFLPLTIKFTAESAVFLYYSLFSPSPWSIEPEDAEFCQQFSHLPAECVSHTFCDFLNDVCFVSAAKLSSYFFYFGVYGELYQIGPLIVCPRILLAIMAVLILTCGLGVAGTRLLVPTAVFGSILLILLFFIFASSSFILKGAVNSLNILEGDFLTYLDGFRDVKNWTQSLMLTCIMGSIVVGPQFSPASHNAIGTRIARVPGWVGFLLLGCASLIALITFGLAGHIINVPSIVTRQNGLTWWARVVIEEDTVIASGIFPGTENNLIHAGDGSSSIVDFIRKRKPVKRYRLRLNATTAFPDCNDPLPLYIAQNLKELTQPIEPIRSYRTHRNTSPYCTESIVQSSSETFFQTPVTSSLESTITSKVPDAYVKPSSQQGINNRRLPSSEPQNSGRNSASLQNSGEAFSFKNVCLQSPPLTASNELQKIECSSMFCVAPDLTDPFWGISAASLIYEVIPMGISHFPGSNMWVFMIFVTVLILGALGAGLQFMEAITCVRDTKFFETWTSEIITAISSFFFLPLIFLPALNVKTSSKELLGRVLVCRLPEAATRLAFPTVALAQIFGTILSIGYEEQAKIIGNRVALFQWVSQISCSIAFAVLIITQNTKSRYLGSILAITLWGVWTFGFPCVIILFNRKSKLSFAKHYWILLVGDVEVIRSHANSILNSAYFPMTQYTFFWSICIKCFCPLAFISLLIQQLDSMIMNDLSSGKTFSALSLFAILFSVIILGLIFPGIFEWVQSPGRNTWSLNELPHCPMKLKNKNKRTRLSLLEELKDVDIIWKRSTETSNKFD